MTNLNLFYQVNVFGNFNSIDVSPENTYKIMTLFRDYNLIPNNFQEFNPSVNINPVIRPSFSSPNGEWIIEVASNKLKVQQNSISPSSSNTLNIEKFSESVSQILNLFLNEFPVKSNRISLVTKTILPALSEEKLDSLYNIFIAQIPFYQQAAPFEWNIRSVGRINFELEGTNESINTITDIGRVQGQMVENNRVTDFDRMSIDFDINTIAENQSTRFEFSSVHEFLVAAIKSRNQILNEVELIIHDERGNN
ncbi:hypothetical protein M4S82_10485 [Planococcus sp. MERTA32b]|nr:hypothetical protein [Planococcus sp. MER TA 32b]